jgi:hypothetical protein
MFTALDLRNQLAFALDAENSDHYTNALDYIPAINSAMKWLTSVVNMAIGQDKIGEEFFREISYSGVFQTNNHSRISLNTFPNEVWTILAINPLPITSPSGITPPVTTDNTLSYFRPDFIHVRADFSCKRLGIEEWANNRQNPFESGYEGDAICGDLVRYAYLNPINHHNTNLGTRAVEVEIRPSIPNKLATVFWAKKPTDIVNITDNIEFPNSVRQLLFDKSLNYISYKQGDQTNLFSVTEKDIQLLLNNII